MSLDYHQLSSSHEAQQLVAILSQSFGSSLTDSQRFCKRLGHENFRLISQAGEVVGGLAIYRMGQWYGEQCVPMAGIAGVGVAPEHRGTGVARQLMSSTLQELHRLDVPISVLYAATQRLYRQVGYEQGGMRCRWELPTAAITLQELSPLQSVNPADYYEVFQKIYTQQAKKNNGNLNRNQAIWENVGDVSEDSILYSYVVGEPSQPNGYILFTQVRSPDGFFLQIRDWATLSAAAVRRIWSFLAAHRSQIERVQWFGASYDPRLLLLSEQAAHVLHQEAWMLRIINVSQALSVRGYPLGVEAELHLDVRDDLIAANNGKFCLKVSQGRGKVTPGGNGDFSVNIRGLSPLYTGYLSPQQLQLIGSLQAAPKALATATKIFSGTPPWMPDFF
ncbi:MAG: enhanced intracellular survival protein Eis [Cyanophyceae cyanobacterium]